MVVSTVSNAPLLPRYRRQLSFGGVLDEAIQLYRQHWRAIVAVSAIYLVPTALVSTAVVLSTPDPATAPPQQAAATGGLTLLSYVVNGILSATWTIALAHATNLAVRGQPMEVGQLVRAGFGRLLALVLSGVVVAVAAILLMAASLPFLVLGLFGVVSLVAVIVWFANPSARKPWLKWLIVLATPFGLPTYFAGRWSLALPSIVLERRGPIDGISRSSQLVAGNWFTATGLLTVVSLIVAVFVYIAIIGGGIAGALIGLGAGAASQPATIFTTIRATEVAVSLASILGQILFGPLTPIALTLLFIDLRNRREGSDLSERVGALEMGFAPSS